jgi:hypothetical protein
VNERVPTRPHVKSHDFFKLMSAVKDSLSRAYLRIRARSKDDPGTAGDQAEEDWADILRDWLPATYRIVTKGRILFDDGSSSPQVDLLVLTPSYPKGLANEKYVFAGGVVAAFECKLTLRLGDIRQAFDTARVTKRKAPPRSGTPYDELNRPPIFGLLAHSQSLGKGDRSLRLYEAVETYSAKCPDHPRELLDLICVADTATIALGKHVLVGKDLNKQELEELSEIGAESAVAALYVVQDEDRRHVDLDFSGAILAWYRIGSSTNVSIFPLAPSLALPFPDRRFHKPARIVEKLPHRPVMIGLFDRHRLKPTLCQPQ